MPEDAVSIGEVANWVVDRVAVMVAFQTMLKACPTAANRRSLINSAYANGAITDREYQALSRNAVNG